MMMKVAVGISILALGGCSVMTVQGPSAQWTPEARRAPACDPDPSWPIKADIALAVAGVLTTIAGIGWAAQPEMDASGAPADHQISPRAGIAVAVGGGVLALASSASAGVGMRRRNECRAAMADYQMVVGPQPYQPAY
jgi:hypothetical protein